MVQTVTQAISVTPSDTDGLDDYCHCLWIGTEGNLSIETKDGGTVVFANVPVGYFWQATERVNATGTTAADIVALYVSDV